MEPARRPQLFDDGLQRAEPFGTDLDLDPPQLHGALAVAHDDHRVVEGDLRRVDAADPQREGTPVGADLEHLVQPARADDGPQPPPDGTVRAELGQARRGQDLGDLEALAQAVPLCGVAVLQRDLMVTASASGADDEPGAGDAPIVGVEVGVDQPPWRAGQRGHRSSLVGLAGLDGEGREPALHRS